MRSDETGFPAFYAANYRRTVAQLYAVTGHLGEAEDAAQEAYSRAWTRWDRLSKYEEPAAWVYTVGYRIAVSRFRQARSTLNALARRGEQQPVAPRTGPSDVTVALVEGLRQLPVHQRVALVLHHLEGWPIEDIARREGVAIGTIKARLSRGRHALAPLLGSEEIRYE